MANKKLTPEQQLAKAQEQFKEAKRILKELEAKQVRRRKFIVADAISEAVKGGTITQENLDKLLDKYVTGESDREFMKLPPLDAPANSEKVTQLNTPENERSAGEHHQTNGHHPQPEYQHQN